MIQLSFNASDERVKTALRARGPRVAEELRRELDALMFELQRRIQGKLSGDVLEQRTGKLIRSIEKRPTTQEGSQLTGLVTGAGGPAFYGVIQERGSASGAPYEIKPKNKLALAFFPAGAAGVAGGQSAGRGASAGIYFKLGARRGTIRPAKIGEFANLGGIVVKSVMHPPIQRRSFMETALDEMRAEIVSRLYEAAARALKG